MQSYANTGIITSNLSQETYKLMKIKFIVINFIH